MNKTKTLHLNLIKKWYDMILSGDKKEEYRELSDYWKARFKTVQENNIKKVTFSNGYRKNRRQMVVEISYIRIGRGIEEWGAVPGKQYFVTVLGKVREL